MARRLLHHASQILPALLTLALAVFLLRSADLGRVAGLLRALGWWLPLLLLPNLLVTLIEAVAWRMSFGALGARPRFPSLVRVRLAVEAVMLGLPSGAVISESLQPYLLKRHCGVPFETAVVASVGRKFFVVVSHGLVLGVVTVLAWPALSRASREMIGRGRAALAAAGGRALHDRDLRRRHRGRRAQPDGRAPAPHPRPPRRPVRGQLARAQCPALRAGGRALPALLRPRAGAARRAAAPLRRSAGSSARSRPSSICTCSARRCRSRRRRSSSRPWSWCARWPCRSRPAWACRTSATCSPSTRSASRTRRRSAPRSCCSSAARTCSGSWSGSAPAGLR